MNVFAFGPMILIYYRNECCNANMIVFFCRMIKFKQAAGQTTEAAKALVCPLQRDVEQLKRDVSEIREILKQRKRHVLREVNEVRPPSRRYTGAFILSYNNK